MLGQSALRHPKDVHLRPGNSFAGRSNALKPRQSAPDVGHGRRHPHDDLIVLAHDLVDFHGSVGECLPHPGAHVPPHRDPALTAHVVVGVLGEDLVEADELAARLVQDVQQPPHQRFAFVFHQVPHPLAVDLTRLRLRNATEARTTRYP